MKFSLFNKLFSCLAIFVFVQYQGEVMAVEEPKFIVESQGKQYEVRKYEKTLVAETNVDASFEDAGNQAFKILADFIFGNNKSQSKIDMTAPVSQKAISEKIDMTAPVTLSKASNGFVVQFTMPEKYTLETLPKPNDSRVNIREIPKRRVAVFRYSGTWSQERYKEKLKEFLLMLEADKLKTLGEPTFARYDPPFMPWFLRRNEIWIEISN